MSLTLYPPLKSSSILSYYYSNKKFTSLRMANKAELILESDETEGTPFQGSGKNHILISPTEDNSWESGSVKVKILNPHDAGTARWRTVYMWDPTNTIHLPDPDDGAILDVIELVIWNVL